MAIFLGGEILSFFIFKLLLFFMNNEKNLTFDRALFKGIIERLFLFLSLVYNLPQALIAFGALKIGTRFISDDNKISNDYFFLGNIISLLISVIYYALWLNLC